MSTAPSNAQRIARPMPDAIHATNATNATNERVQDQGSNPHVPDAPTPVDNRNRYSAADLEFAAFLASRQPWTLNKERFQLTLTEASIREYDRITDYNLTFLRGQRIAEENKHGRTAA